MVGNCVYIHYGGRFRIREEPEPFGPDCVYKEKHEGVTLQVRKLVNSEYSVVRTGFVMNPGRTFSTAFAFLNCLFIYFLPISLEIHNGPFPSCCEPHYESEAKC